MDLGGIHLTGLAQVRTLAMVEPPGACPRSVDGLVALVVRAASPSGVGRRPGRDSAPARARRRAPARGRRPSPCCEIDAVEAEDELVEVALQVRLVNRALVGAQQPSLGQRGDAMNCGQQLAGVLPAGASGPLAARLMGVAELVDAAVALPSISDDSCARLDVLGDERVQ